MDRFVEATKMYYLSFILQYSRYNEQICPLIRYTLRKIMLKIIKLSCNRRIFESVKADPKNGIFPSIISDADKEIMHLLF